MAQYKHSRFLSPVTDDIYDQLTLAGLDAPVPGIYRCVVCGREVCVIEGAKLPPQNHHTHKVGIIQVFWQLVVATDPTVK